MEREGAAALQEAGHGKRASVYERSADMRYVGQEHAVTVDLPSGLFKTGDIAGIKAAFDAEHLQRYGTNAPGEPAEFVSLRLAARGKMETPKTAAQDPHDSAPTAALVRRKLVHFGSAGWVETPVYARAILKCGNTVSGPALIEEHASTTVLWPGDEMHVDAFGSLNIKVGDGL
jgi:N-methylhydantoinase A